MIKSPYDALGIRSNEPAPGRILQGEFQCQTCFVVDEEARYAPDIKLLFWNCTNGHFNEVKDFEAND